MNGFPDLISRLLRLLEDVGEIILGAIVSIELALRAALRGLGAPPLVQTVVLCTLAVLLIVGSIRLFGGLIRVAVVLGLVLIALHILMPALQR